MRSFTLVQDIATDPDNHWKIFLDPAFDKAQYIKGFGFPSYEVLEHKDGPDEVVHRIRVTPKLDVPAVVFKVLGPGFTYTDVGTFDKKRRIWRSRSIPNVWPDRMRSESVVKCEPAGEGRSRRICVLSVEAKVFGIGGMVEAALEKNLRQGWEQGAAFMNAWLRDAKR